MALQKDIGTPMRQTASYWKINEIKIIKKDNLIVVTLGGWKNRQDRQDYPDTQIYAEIIELTLLDRDQGIFPYCYNEIKKSEEFSGAEDI